MSCSNPQTEDRVCRANRITWLSVAVNVVLTIGKLLAGLLGHSAAMVADAIHSLSDFATDFAVMIGMRLAKRPEDCDHPYGHGKYETLTAILIGCVLAAAGIAIACRAGITLWNAMRWGVFPQVPGAIALGAGIISIIAKEWLYHVTIKVAKETRNEAVKANAWHHRSDAFSSVGTTLGIAAAVCFGGKWVLCDAAAAIVVGGILTTVAWDILRQSVDKLLECGMTEEEKARIFELIFLAPSVYEPHHLRTRRVGTLAVIEFHLRVDGAMTVSEAHKITCHIETLLRHEFGSDAIITIHVEPRKN